MVTLVLSDSFLQQIERDYRCMDVQAFTEEALYRFDDHSHWTLLEKVQQRPELPRTGVTKN